ncbi:phosphoglycerate mutase-like protein [Clavulina sp. PMI_390]|nr:phosphoglycerate mutase-like protein [Clavulina sp. PMI_390]
MPSDTEKGPALPRDPSIHFDYQVLPDFFIHTDPNATEADIGPAPARFGLLDSTAERWSNLDARLDQLAKEEPKAKFKVIWAGRHGQGWHNLAEAKYGTKAWDDYWAMLNGDGEIVWGPDPKLTPLGEDQARLAHDVWEAELSLSVPVPLPSTLYSSPFTRALSTAQITFTSIPTLLTHSQLPPILVVENIREVNGEHTCDKRDTRSYIEETFVDRKNQPEGGPVFNIEDGFTEDDELWTPEREPDPHVLVRAIDVLDRIFEYDTSRYTSITSHSGWITQLLVATKHRRYNLPTGGVIPLVIKATPK